DPEMQQERVWMTPPVGMHYRKISTSEHWTKADVINGNKVKLELFRRFGVLPGSSDVHVVEFFAGFQDVDIFHYRLDGHMKDKAEDDEHVAELLASDEITAFPSGELVAPLIDWILTGTGDPLPVNLPNRGQVENLGDDVVVECIGVVEDGAV